MTNSGSKLKRIWKIVIYVIKKIIPSDSRLSKHYAMKLLEFWKKKHEFSCLK